MLKCNHSNFCFLQCFSTPCTSSTVTSWQMFILITVSSDQADDKGMFKGSIWTEQGMTSFWTGLGLTINNKHKYLTQEKLEYGGLEGDMFNFAVNMIECQDEIIYQKWLECIVLLSGCRLMFLQLQIFSTNSQVKYFWGSSS